MASLMIKNIPDHIHKQLKKIARQHHRSLNSEVIHCLETAAYHVPNDSKSILERAWKLREKTENYYLTEKELNQNKNEGRP